MFNHMEDNALEINMKNFFSMTKEIVSNRLIHLKESKVNLLKRFTPIEYKRQQIQEILDHTTQQSGQQMKDAVRHKNRNAQLVDAVRVLACNIYPSDTDNPAQPFMLYCEVFRLSNDSTFDYLKRKAC